MQIMKQTLVLKFKISGPLRYLSHHETVAMFHRVVVRAEVGLCFSQGFNPRPVLSLPLPRSVGVDSDGDLLCLSVLDQEQVGEAGLREKISGQLPEGCELLEVQLMPPKTSYQPQQAEYVFPVAGLKEDADIMTSVASLESIIAKGEPLIMERVKASTRKVRKKDVGAFIKSVDCCNDEIIVKCKITLSGSVRVDEMMKILNVDHARLNGPVRRRSIEWLP